MVPLIQVDDQKGVVFPLPMVTIRWCVEEITINFDTRGSHFVTRVPRRLIKRQPVADTLPEGRWIRQITGGLSIPCNPLVPVHFGGSPRYASQ